MTRLTLPRFLRATDSVDAPWLLHSLLATDVEAKYVAGATGVELQGPHAGEELLKAGAVVAHDLRIFAPAVGQGRVTTELRTDAGGDAEAETLPILPQGIPKTLATQAVAEGAAVTLPKLTAAEVGRARHGAAAHHASPPRSSRPWRRRSPTSPTTPTVAPSRR